MNAAIRFAAVFAGMYPLHHVGDFWLQSDCQAQAKGEPSRAGQLACARHVAGYTALSAAGVEILDRRLGLRLDWRRKLAGQAFNALSHYFFDRRWTADLIYRWIDPVSAKKDYIARVPGAKQCLDQAFHIFCLAVAAAIIAGKDDE